MKKTRVILSLLMVVTVAIAVVCVLQLRAEAQGIVGGSRCPHIGSDHGSHFRSPGLVVDPRFGSANEISGGMGAFDYYQTAKDVASCATPVTFVFATLLAYCRVQRAKLLAANAAALRGVCIRDVRVGWLVVAKWIAVVVVVTLAIHVVHVAGAFVVDRADGYPIGWAGEY